MSGTTAKPSVDSSSTEVLLKEVSGLHQFRKKGAIVLSDKERIPAVSLLQKLLSLGPNLMVYYLCKTAFTEAGLKRLACADLLSQEMMTSF